MVADGIGVERVDYIRVPVTDIEEANRFYGELLGLPESTTGEDVFPEYETANVTLGMWMPESVGMEFVPSSGVALRVMDVAAARAELEAAGVDSPKELVQRNAANLAQTFQELDAARPNWIRQVPSQATVEKWIAEARSLEGAISH